LSGLRPYNNVAPISACMTKAACDHGPILQNFFVIKNCGLDGKNITIVNDTSSVIRKKIISDATSCGITYDRHSGVIYTPGVTKGTFIAQVSLLIINI